MLQKFISTLVAVAAAFLLVSCGASSTDDYYDDLDYGTIEFHDEAETNAQTIDDFSELVFTDAEGNEVALKDRIGEKNVVLVMTRGYAFSVCLYCSTQTARLISRYDEIAAEDAEVITVFPVRAIGDKARLDEFLKAIRQKLDESSNQVPFPVLLDVELNVVEQLGIRESLSKPATYIIDKNGQVRFAYVGDGVSDRPSVDAIISQLRQL